MLPFHNLKNRNYTHYHKLRTNIHPNIHLQRAFNIDAEISFKWVILEYVNSVQDKEKLKKELLELEQRYITELEVCNPLKGYNISKSAYSIMLNRKHTPETRNKISMGHLGKEHTEETKKKMRDAKLNKDCPLHIKDPTEETKKKMRDVKLGCKLSEEHRKNIGLGMRKKVINLDTLVEFDSIKEAAKFYTTHGSLIGRVCKGEIIKAGGYRWAYL